jgi:hypothetical protein
VVPHNSRIIKNVRAFFVITQNLLVSDKITANIFPPSANIKTGGKKRTGLFFRVVLPHPFSILSPKRAAHPSHRKKPL